jgi:hypothetical protein
MKGKYEISFSKTFLLLESRLSEGLLEQQIRSEQKGRFLYMM